MSYYRSNEAFELFMCRSNEYGLAFLLLLLCWLSCGCNTREDNHQKRKENNLKMKATITRMFASKIVGLHPRNKKMGCGEKSSSRRGDVKLATNLLWTIICTISVPFKRLFTQMLTSHSIEKPSVFFVLHSHPSVDLFSSRRLRYCGKKEKGDCPGWNL